MADDASVPPLLLESGHSDDQAGGGGNTSNADKKDRLLPIASINRIMKKAVPKNGKITKDAKEAVQECVTEFISLITGEAWERCTNAKRKSINGGDVLRALSTFDFDHYIDPLALYLQHYRESTSTENTVSQDQPPPCSSTAATLTTAIPTPVNPTSTIQMQQTSPNLAMPDTFVALNLPISPKLSQYNYPTWKAQVLQEITTYNLTSYLDYSAPASTIISDTGLQINNPAFVAWCRQDRMLIEWLRSSISESILAQFPSCSTTAEFWSELHHTFSSASHAYLLNMRSQLQSAIRGNTSCGEYLNKVKAIGDELASLGAPVSDDELVHVVLNGIGSEFNSIIAVVTAHHNKEVRTSFSELCSMILNYEAIVQTQIQTVQTQLPSASFPQAFLARNQFRPRFSSPQQFRPRFPRPPISTSQPLLPSPRPPFNFPDQTVRATTSQQYQEHPQSGKRDG